MNQHFRILIPISMVSLAALLVILVMPVHASQAAMIALPNRTLQLLTAVIGITT